MAKRIQDYLNYVKDVLGIEHLFFIDDQLTAKKIVISVVDFNLFSAAERELLEKMISALQLDSKSFIVIDSSDLALYQPEYLLKLSSVITTGHSPNTVETYSPRLLLTSPELKKTAWSDMQIFLQRIK